jgi:formyltetrahydrofolate-dependent phosphoribosylglycinamide formyltransferase
VTRAAPLRIGVLISGTGRSLDHLLAEARAGRLPIEIVGVISSREDVRGVSRAREEKLPVAVLPRARFDSPASYGDAIARQLDEWRVELVVMAGFLKLWTIPPRFAGRVMNIHPALLPGFGGAGMHGEHVHAAVLASGAKESGCTVHFADDRYDQGPVILQRKVPVLPGDTVASLAQRVFEQEKLAYPEAIRLFAEGRIEVVGGRVRVRE